MAKNPNQAPYLGTMKGYHYQDPISGRFGVDPRNGSLYTMRLNQKWQNQARALLIAYSKLGGQSSPLKEVNKRNLAWVKGQAISNLRQKMAEHRRPEGGRTGFLISTIRNEKSHEYNSAGFEFMVPAKVKDVMGKYPSYPGGKPSNRNYAFALEYGSHYWVGKFLPFTFLGPRPSRAERESGARHSQVIGTHALERRSGTQGTYRHPHRPNAARGNAYRNGRYTGVHNRGDAAITDRLIGPRERANRKSSYVKKAYRVQIRNPVPEYAYGRDAGKQWRASGVYQTNLKKVFEELGYEVNGGRLKPVTVKGKKVKAGV